MSEKCKIPKSQSENWQKCRKKHWEIQNQQMYKNDQARRPFHPYGCSRYRKIQKIGGSITNGHRWPIENNKIWHLDVQLLPQSMQRITAIQIIRIKKLRVCPTYGFIKPNFGSEVHVDDVLENSRFMNCWRSCHKSSLNCIWRLILGFVWRYKWYNAGSRSIRG